MNTSVIRSEMEHSALLRKLIYVLRKMGMIHALHTLQALVKRKRLNGQKSDFYHYYIDNKNKFDEVMRLLQDESSKKTYCAVIEYRSTYKIALLKDVIVKPQYFPKDIVKHERHEVFIDGGAYIGDTVQDYCKYYLDNKLALDDKLYLWECDDRNIKLIKKLVNKGMNYTIIPKAMWSSKTRIGFKLDGTSGSKQDNSSNILIDADSIDNIHFGERVTFIKMDIEGAEIEALIGAEQTIKAYKPKLAICIYHRPSDLFTIPLMIHECVPEYKIYIRHHSDTYAETVMYAVL